MKLWQVILDYSVVGFLSILFTHQLKIAFDKFIPFDALQVKDIFKIAGLLMGATVLFYLTYSLYIRFAYSIIYEIPNLPEYLTSVRINIIFIINFCLYFLIWTVFYVAVKGLMELNKSRETRLNLESNLRESRLNTLKGQINPHFMFNSLNNIRGLMLEDVPRARNMLTSLSETLRYSLTKSDVNAIALEDELEMIYNFIDISKIQFEDRLQFQTDIDKESLSIQIPPMIIQMLVENAIKHGISNLKEGGTVSLSTKRKDEQLLIEVANSGTLRTIEYGTQVGLRNIRQRLELLYGESASFSLNEVEHKVVAQIKIPLT